MSLPSQSARTSARTSSVNYRRSRGNPVKRVLPAVLVIGALALILWFALIRPSKAADPASQTAASQTDPVTGQPVVINNSAPARSLPGSGDRPDTQREVEDTIASNSTSTSTPATDQIRRNTVLNSTPQTQPDNSSLLDATRNQPVVTEPLNQPGGQPSSQPIVQPSTQPTQASRSTGGTERVRLQLDTARRMVDQNDRVAARRLLSQTLNTPNLSESDAQKLRGALTDINKVLVFGPVVAPNDPICEEYKVQSGDSLSRIASRRELATHWKLIQRVNQIANPSRIRLGQTLKLVRGPFHAVVYKGDHRMDIFHGSPSNPSDWVYITSLNVGLGADNGTPVGLFTVSTNKLENPGWVNPRDASEQYAPNDPLNPIGEFWLGLDGVGQYASLSGYGIHGTINPESIGDDQSMGCVRLADDDIALVYELLVERASVVEIRP